MYNSDNLQCMINCLEEYGYSYTKYEHSNGYCTINSDLLLKQLKLNEQEIRNKAIDEFAERLHGLCGYEEDGFQYPYLLHESRIDEIAEQLKAGGKK